MGVLTMRAQLVGVYIQVPHFEKLPYQLPLKPTSNPGLRSWVDPGHDALKPIYLIQNNDPKP